MASRFQNFGLLIKHHMETANTKCDSVILMTGKTHKTIICFDDYRSTKYIFGDSKIMKEKL